jgi:hypothetical protein
MFQTSLLSCVVSQCIVTIIPEAFPFQSCRYMGTITGIGDLDPIRWPKSDWRSLKVCIQSVVKTATLIILFMSPCVCTWYAKWVLVNWYAWRNWWCHSSTWIIEANMCLSLGILCTHGKCSDAYWWQKCFVFYCAGWMGWVYCRWETTAGLSLGYWTIDHTISFVPSSTCTKIEAYSWKQR